MNWPIESNHPVYGECVMMGIIEGEQIRWFINRDKVVSMIPLNALEDYEEFKEKEMQELLRFVHPA